MGESNLVYLSPYSLLGTLKFTPWIGGGFGVLICLECSVYEEDSRKEFLLIFVTFIL